MGEANSRSWNSQQVPPFAKLHRSFLFLFVHHTRFSMRLWKWSFLYLTQRQPAKHRQSGSVCKSTRYAQLVLLLRHTIRHNAHTAAPQIQRITKCTLHVQRPIAHVRNTLEACCAKQSSNHDSKVMSLFFPPFQVWKSGWWDNTTWYLFKGLFRKAGQRAGLTKS